MWLGDGDRWQPVRLPIGLPHEPAGLKPRGGGRCDRGRCRYAAQRRHLDTGWYAAKLVSAVGR